MKHTKKTMKTIALALSVLTLGSAFVGCSTGGGNGGGNNVANDVNDLEIAYWNSGLGDAYIKKIVDEFKKEYPQYNVSLDTGATTSLIEDTLDKGANYNSIDLYVTVKPRAVDHQYIEPLGDLLNVTIEGESKTIGQKFNQDILGDLKDKDGTYYHLSYYAGVQGITYNASIIDGVTYQVPKTTDELRVLVAELQTNNLTPFIHYKGEDGGYWSQVYEAWRAQYVGLDEFYAFFDAKELDECTTVEEAKSKFVELMSDETDGRYAVLELLNELVNYNNCVNGSNSLEFFAAQSRYLTGEACMMVNGAWMEKEMEKLGNGTLGNFKLMKTPVFSKIVEKFEGADKNMADSKLSAIIDLIDAGTPYATETYGCLESTYNRVYEARNLMAANSTGHAFTVPNYATAKAAAKDFIKFYYSDKATEIFVNEQHLVPVVNFSDDRTIDASSWSAWSQNCYDIQRSSRLFSIDGRNSKHEVFSISGAGAYGRLAIVPTLSTNPQSMTYQSASQIWATLKSEAERNAEAYIIDSGII